MTDRIQLLRKHGSGRILCNLAAGVDADSIDAYLVRAHAPAVASGLKYLAKESNASEIFIYAPNGMELSALTAVLSDYTVTIHFGPASPVLRDESALYAAIQTGEIRSDPEGYALRRAYDGEGFDCRPTLIVDGETARYAAESPRIHKLIRMKDADPVETCISTPLATVLQNNGLVFDKALLLGGNLGRFVSQEALSTTLVSSDRDFDSITLISVTDCMVQALSDLFATSREQSCQRCVLCREGTFQLSAIFSAIAGGKGTRDSLPVVEDISPLIAEGALCPFGRSMVQPALSGTALFKSELEAHIIKKSCPANTCTAFAKYVIDPCRCTGCGDCMDACEYDAIDGKSGFIHVIDESMCEKCDACRKVCPENAILLNAPQLRVPPKPVRVGTYR